MLSFFAILLSSSQAFIFNSLAPPSSDRKSNGDYWRYLALIIKDSKQVERDYSSGICQECTPRWKMVFVWQSSMMLMAYATIFFLAGLTVYVCTPLFNGEISTAGAKVKSKFYTQSRINRTEVSIFYLVVSGLAGTIFIYCSFWAYRFVDLDEITESLYFEEVPSSGPGKLSSCVMDDASLNRGGSSTTRMDGSHIRRQVAATTDEV